MSFLDEKIIQKLKLIGYVNAERILKNATLKSRLDNWDPYFKEITITNQPETIDSLIEFIAFSFDELCKARGISKNVDAGDDLVERIYIDEVWTVRIKPHIGDNGIIHKSVWEKDDFSSDTKA